jgi:hypothetical protein
MIDGDFRDQAAIAILTSLVSFDRCGGGGSATLNTKEHLAEKAFELAQALVVERKKWK